MTNTLGILAGVLLAAVTPLSDTQTQRLDGATDHSATFDEAAFYALLENAAQWEPTLAGATVPDYPALFEQPADLRGQYFLIEGKLTSEWKLPTLARQGWEGVRAFTVEYEPEQYLIVFLTKPPDFQRIATGPDGNIRLDHQGRTVKLGARFFKVLDRTSQANQKRSYLLFVGHSFNEMTESESEGGGLEKLAVVLPIVLVIALLVVYMMIRRSSGDRESQIDKFHRERAMRRAGEAAPSPPEDEDDESADLPEDAADALNQLDQKQPEP